MLRISTRLGHAVVRVFALIHGLFLAAAPLSAASFYEAPFSIEFTLTTSDEEPTVVRNVISLTTTSTKITNKEILKECAAAGLIPSISGWSLVFRYDAENPDDTSTPLFLRHSSGSLVDPSAVIRIESPAGAGTGKIVVGRTSSLSGSMAVKLFLKTSLVYQGMQGTCYGTVQISVRVAGSSDGMLLFYSPMTAKFEGLIEGSDTSLLSATLKTGSFSKK